MKRFISILIVTATLLTALTSCSQESKKAAFFIKSAWEATDDGWVYVMNYEDFYKPGNHDDLIKYWFYGFNVRYRFNDDYITTVYKPSEDPSRGSGVTSVIVPSVLLAGGGPDKEKRDMQLINGTILDSGQSVDELLALDPDDYAFESIDKDMFFRLLHECLESEIPEDRQDQTYRDKDVRNLLTEQMYIDGYKFQVGSVNVSLGYVGVVYIDILYRTGDGYKDYIQLSDMIDDGSATDEQREIFSKLQKIAFDCMEEDSYIANADSYRKDKTGEVEFERLYKMMQNIHINNYGQYEVDTSSLAYSYPGEPEE